MRVAVVGGKQAFDPPQTDPPVSSWKIVPLASFRPLSPKASPEAKVKALPATAVTVKTEVPSVLLNIIRSPGWITMPAVVRLTHVGSNVAVSVVPVICILPFGQPGFAGTGGLAATGGE